MWWAFIYIALGFIDGGPMVGGTYQKLGPYADLATCEHARQYRIAELKRSDARTIIAGSYCTDKP